MSKNTNQVEDYTINRFTMAILPDTTNKMFSEVLEVEENLVVEKRPLELISESCSYYGSSYMGRKDGTKDVMGVTHKPPIVIDPTNSLYFFPTTSSSRPQCAWLSHSYVKGYSEAEHDNTKVTFTNNKTVILNMSIGSFENQLFRTAQLRTIMSSRIEQEQRKMNMLLLPKGEGEVNTFYEQIIRELNRYS
ncbi:competence protein ComK [Metabacillus litoralis]|uniref:competence protein ComK n=1 Tax=Metabacillus litoralis TaxID=152268 RepID=UPI001CFE9C48|nr:competence protein ComK [Metabacillus litoralis]